MESSGPHSKNYEPSNHRWAELLGTSIAVLTLTIPIGIIAYYSSTNNSENLPKTTYLLLKKEK